MEMENADNQTINIGTGIGTSVLSVAQILLKKYNRNSGLNVSGDFRIGDIRHNFADLSRMKKLLNYEPKVTFNQGIEDFANWVLKQPIHETQLYKSFEEMKEKGFLKS